MNKIYYERPKPLPKKTESDTNKRDNIGNGVYVSQDMENNPYMSGEEQENQYYQPSYKEKLYEKIDMTMTKNSRVRDWIANGVLVALSFLFVIMMVAFLSEMRYSFHSYTRDADDLWWYANCENYWELVTAKYSNEAAGVRESGELSEIYGIADYFEAASMYKVALFNEDTMEIGMCLMEMEKARIKMGEVAYFADDIDEMFGINKKE